MKNKNITLVVMMSAFLILSGSVVTAHEGHEHLMTKAPHGGEIVMVGDYHYEMLIKPGEIDLYVFDGKLNPLPLKGMEGSLVIKSAESTSKNIPFEPAGDYFKAAVDVSSMKSFIAIVTITINGKANEGRFRHSSTEAS